MTTMACTLPTATAAILPDPYSAQTLCNRLPNAFAKHHRTPPMASSKRHETPLRSRTTPPPNLTASISAIPERLSDKVKKYPLAITCGLYHNLNHSNLHHILSCDSQVDVLGIGDNGNTVEGVVMQAHASVRSEAVRSASREQREKARKVPTIKKNAFEVPFFGGGWVYFRISATAI